MRDKDTILLESAYTSLKKELEENSVLFPLHEDEEKIYKVVNVDENQNYTIKVKPPINGVDEITADKDGTLALFSLLGYDGYKKVG